MTLSDPLLKELKGHIAKLVLGSNPPYGDENETVFLLCHCIESIFIKGLIRHDGFTPWRTDSFSWFYQLVRKYHRIIPLAFKLAFEEVLNDPKTRTQPGKTRLLIRSCLKRRCLHIPIQFHVENQDYEDSSLRVNYNPKGSIIGHDILSQIFLSLILQLSNYEFNFDLSNSAFLDESWQIPQLVKAEFVPCDKLGLTLGFPMGFCVIADIIENSLAAELNDKISVGDIMDEFNGTALRNFYGSKLESLFRKNRSQPFKITFIKATDPKGQLYLPAIKLYRILGLDPEKLTYSRPSGTIDLEDQQFDLELNRHNEREEIEDDFTNDEPRTATTLIQGLDPSDFEQQQNENSNRQQSDEVKSNYCDILAELGTTTSSDGLPNHPSLLDLDLTPPLIAEWDRVLQDGENVRLDEDLITANKDFQNNKQGQEQQLMDKGSFPKYFDDSNPCNV